MSYSKRQDTENHSFGDPAQGWSVSHKYVNRATGKPSGRKQFQRPARSAIADHRFRWMAFAILSCVRPSLTEPWQMAHEAGHCVLDVLFDIPFTVVEVFSDQHPPAEDDSGYAGIVRSDRFKSWPSYALFESPDFDLERAKAYAEPLVMSFHAGRIAESIYIGRKAPASVARFDRQGMKIVCECIGLIGQNAREWLAQLEVATWALLQNPDIWSAVVRVAEALLARNVLSYRAVGRIMYGSRAAKQLTVPEESPRSDCAKQ